VSAKDTDAFEINSAAILVAINLVFILEQ
jgi:hypothetical protein